MKILVLQKNLGNLLARKGIKTTSDPGEKTLAVVCDSSTYKYAPKDIPLFILLSGGMSDWAVRQACPGAFFSQNPQDIVDKIEALYNEHTKYIPPKATKESIVLASYANKGGVGKTTTATALADTLAGKGISTVICDFDFGGPDVASFFNITKDTNYFQTGDVFAALVEVNSNLYVLPGPKDVSISSIKGSDLVRVINELKNKFSVIVCDTCPAPWEKGYMSPVFSTADLVYAVVNQGKFSVKETAIYGPQLLLMGVTPDKVRIIVNQYNPKLTSLREVERAFCSGFKQSIKTLPYVAAVIPEDWEGQIKALGKGQVTYRDIWEDLCSEIEGLLGYNAYVKNRNIVEKGFNVFSKLRNKLGKGRCLISRL